MGRPLYCKGQENYRAALQISKNYIFLCNTAAEIVTVLFRLTKRPKTKKETNARKCTQQSTLD